jgi:hypothetical protein
MGVHVILEIDPYGIDASDWAAVHDETRALLEAWEPRLLGLGYRTIEGTSVPMYLRSIRRDEDDPKKACWTVVGDRETLQTAEDQSLHRDLSYYGKARGRHRKHGAQDIIVSAAAPENEYVSGRARLRQQDARPSLPLRPARRRDARGGALPAARDGGR